MTRIVLHIDRIVLHGVASAHRAAFSRALQKELGRRLSTVDSAKTLAARPDAARLVVPAPPRAATRPAQLGRDVARGIARGLGS